MKARQKYSSIILFGTILIAITFNHQTVFAQKYFPLQIGNRWDYKRSEWTNPSNQPAIDTLIVKVVADTVMPNGKQYFILRYGTPENAYWRVDSNWVYKLNGANEFKSFKLHSHVGEWWPMSDEKGDSVATVYLDMTENKSLFGIDLEVLHFRIMSPAGIYYDNLSDKFGEIESVSEDRQPGTVTAETKLLGCIIDGITYGELIANVADYKIPDKFTVYQNTPNPFGAATLSGSSSTTISWQQNQTSITKLNIYNSLGQKVRTLFNDQIDVGKHSLVWDGKNDSGQPLRSGMYFYEIIQGSNRIVKQMVMIR